MKRTATISLIAAVLLSANAITLSAQDEKPKDTRQQAAETADWLMEYLKLEDYQVFQVDSTLQHNFVMLEEEWAKMNKSGVSNTDFYQNVSDRIMNSTDSTFKCIFTPEQWSRYMKSMYGREKRSRDKRMSEWEKRTTLKNDK